MTVLHINIKFKTSGLVFSELNAFQPEFNVLLWEISLTFILKTRKEQTKWRLLTAEALMGATDKALIA